MAKLKHDIEYFFTRIAVELANMLTAKAADRFAVALGTGAYHLLRSRRRIAVDNIKRALPGRFSDDEIDGIIRKVFQNIAQSMIEFARFRRLKRDGVRRIVVSNGQDNIRKAIERGKGGLFVTAHFGNWELMGAWGATLGYEMDFLTGVQHNEKVNDLFNQFRREMDVGIIPASSSTLRSVFKALKANHIVGLVADQHSPSKEIVMDFFGRTASHVKGPALFAVRTGCVVLPYMLLRERYDRHVVIPGEPIYPPDSGDEEKDIETITAAYLKFFEEVITRYPDHWMWTHRRWKL